VGKVIPVFLLREKHATSTFKLYFMSNMAEENSYTRNLEAIPPGSSFNLAECLEKQGRPACSGALQRQNPELHLQYIEHWFLLRR
jgi:hypothetical protein